MQPVEIKPIGELDAKVAAPPSKAYTLRALFIAALADSKSKLINGLFAEDQQYAANALGKFGAIISFDGKNFIVQGTAGHLNLPKEEIFIGNSGVTARFLTTFAGLAHGKVIITGDERMQQRPIQDLLDAIRPLGIEGKSTTANNCPPIEINGGNFKGGLTSLRGDKSSQYFSSILISAPYAKNDVTIKTAGILMSKPYIDITIDCMKSFGVEVENEDYKKFKVQNGQRYVGREYKIEGDYSSASYFFAAAAVTGGKIEVENLNPDSVQGDKYFLEILKKMGSKVKYGKTSVTVGGAELKGVEVDMSNYPDIVPTLAVVAAFAKGKTKINNIGHLRLKESDRIKAPVNELRKIGINAEEKKNSIEIEGGQPKGAEIETYNDHRIAMSFAVAGLAVDGIKIKNMECVNKSFPRFFEELGELGR